MGIYQIRNRESGRILVDSSVNRRASDNKLRMQLNTGSLVKYPELQNDWKTLGAEAFEFEVLEELEPEDSPAWEPQADLQALLELSNACRPDRCWAVKALV